MKTAPSSHLPRHILRCVLLSVLALLLTPGVLRADVVLTGGGLSLVEEGGTIGTGNLAASGTAFAKDLLSGFPAHTIAHLTDQTFGNSNSWIGNSSGTFAGVSLGATPVTVSSIAFGRDNTGAFTDRTLGIYTLQYTTVPNPSAATPDASWTTIGTLNYGAAGGTNYASPSLRHRFFFNAVSATGIRLLVPAGGLATGTCIDELEVYPGIVVNTTADELDTPAGANISLREAVRDCPAGAAIGFAAALSGQTITLTRGVEIVLAKSVTIDAMSLPTEVTIDGGAGSNRICSISSGRVVSLRGLRFTGGNGGGAANDGGGGAIYSTGQLSVDSCTFSGNSADFGGAIGCETSAPTAISACTFAANSATSGGCVYINGPCTITKSTFVNNSGGGGSIYCPFSSNVSMENCTIVQNNAGGIFNSAQFATATTIKNCIVANNLSGNLTGSTAITQVGANITSGDPLVAPLANYGGRTQTMALLAGSPARNAAVGSTATSDQRGFPIVGTADLGAFETQIGAIANQSINEDTSSGAIPFTVGTVGTLSATSSNTAVIANAGIVVGGSGANRTVTVTPVANANGASTITITDSLNGETQQFIVTANPVNDAPSFTKGANQVVTQNSGARTVAGWATGFNAGPADESGQAILSFVVSNNNNALFSAQPAVGTNGTLTFTPATNAAGIATVTVQVQDNGGTAAGGVDTSTAQTFTITVTPVVTTIADSGPGSLRAALINAATIPGATAVAIAPGLSGQTINLASEILVDDTGGVTLDASSLAGGITVSGSASRLFTVGSGASLSLTGITLTGGTGNGAAFSGTGGAIFNLGTLTLNRCTLHGNSSANTGGAISSGSFGGTVTVTATNCTFTANSSADGGAIFNGTGSTVSLRHCTIVGNSATGAGTGGVKANGTVTITASIIAANTGGSGVENLGGAAWSSTNTITSGNPLVGPLADNGGPTKSMALLAGSPALDFNNIPVAGVDTDQRGLPRIREGDGIGSIYADAGAVEMQTPPAAGAEQLIVTTTADENDATGTLGAGVSLREAIRVAAPGRTVGFAPALSGQTITLTLGAEIVLAKSVTIDAMSLPAELTIDGGAGFNRILYVNSGQIVSLRGLRFTGGNAQGAANSGGGGAIFSDGQLTIDSCTFSGNAATAGGAIACTGTTTINACTFASNGVGVNGGALLIQSGSATVTKSTFRSNSTDPNGFGGAIRCATSASASIENCTIVQNSGESEGGISGSPMTTIKNCIVALNTGGNLSGSITQVGANITSGDPLLAPLSNYGGRTQTMALRPGSPARDAAVGSTITSDQRGFPVVGTPDIGAYEAGTFNSFLTWSWETAGSALTFTGDTEGDGAVNGLEYATRRNPSAGDVSLSPSLTSLGLGGHSFQFRYQKDARDLRYIVQRSPNLALPGNGWTEIYRYDSSTGVITENGTATGNENAATQFITITDSAVQPQLFWRLVIEQVP